MAVIRVTFSNLSLSAGPSSIYLLSPPSTVTITGDLFDQTYSMPRVEYFDSDGYPVGSVYATSVSGSTSVTASVPDLSSAYSGATTYTQSELQTSELTAEIAWTVTATDGTTTRIVILTIHTGLPTLLWWLSGGSDGHNLSLMNLIN